MELASQECCLQSVLFTRRYVTFVLVIITLQSHCIVLCEKKIELDRRSLNQF